jgi:glutamate transport system substrate-binding protein
MRLRNFAAVALVGALALTGCGKEGGTGSGDGVQVGTATGVTVAGSPTFDRMKSRGKVVIGVKEDQPNLGYKDPTTGKYSGFDISVARLLAAKLGFAADKIEYKAIPSVNREQAIVNGDIDYYVGTYSITDARKQKIAFAGPYYVAGQDLLVRKGETAITGPDTIKGKTVCSAKGSTPIKNIKDNKAKYGAETVEFDKYSDCVRELLNNKVDAVTTDDAILKGYAAQDPDNLKVVGKPFSQERYGVGIPKGDVAMCESINTLLETARSNVAWMQIYNDTLGKSGAPATQPETDTCS